MNSLRTTALQPHSFPGGPESRVVAIRHDPGRAPIKADRGAQLRLLDLQTIDSALAQLEHRRKTLPEHAEINALNAAVATTSADLVAAETAVRDLEAEQDRAEAELQPVRERLSRNQTRIADGSIADPKALSSMVEEVGHLQRRISDLEDAELEIMEQLESAAASLERLRIRAGELDEQLADAVTRRDHALAALEVQVDQHRAERAELSPLLPADLLALYDKIGASHNGVGAAELRQRRCTGCQLEVNAADLGTFAAAADDDVLRCEECSRILVRTASSGL
jgi:predicted  nucleic acid-binding Zn-ribbon protein